MKMKEYKIYFLVDPISNEIRYVGQTSMSLKNRLYHHFIDKRKSPKKDWIDKMIKISIYIRRGQFS